jgi:hypothetical protein
LWLPLLLLLLLLVLALRADHHEASCVTSLAPQVQFEQQQQVVYLFASVY